MHVARLQDWVVILSVMGAAAALYISAGFILLRPFIAPRKIQPKLGIVGMLVLAATAFSIICIGYAYFVEPYNLEVKTVRLQIKGLKSPVKIAQVSDTHSDNVVRLENKVLSELEQIKPDVILFSGDSVNSLDGIPIFNKFAKRLTELAPCFAVKGDWDFAFPNVDVLENSKLDVLNGCKVLQIHGSEICFVGADSGSSLLAAISNAPKGIPTIAMFHNPDADLITAQKTEGVDLYICGHTHGGQIALPIYGALITQSRQGKKFESGLHKIKNTWIYTNRGLGMEGHFPRLRFFARPELTVFELSGSN